MPCLPIPLDGPGGETVCLTTLGRPHPHPLPQGAAIVAEPGIAKRDAQPHKVRV